MFKATSFRIYLNALFLWKNYFGIVIAFLAQINSLTFATHKHTHTRVGMTSLPSSKKKTECRIWTHREENVVGKFESFKSECYCGTMPKTVCNKNKQYNGGKTEEKLEKKTYRD